MFFKQKTAYEMRISDWSSDVCSSDLPGDPLPGLLHDSVGLAVGAEVADALEGRAELGWLDPHGLDPHPYAAVIDRALLDEVHDRQVRSAEHTSELQSLMRTSYDGFCLKKKNTRNTITQQHTIQ